MIDLVGKKLAISNLSDHKHILTLLSLSSDPFLSQTLAVEMVKPLTALEGGACVLMEP